MVRSGNKPLGVALLHDVLNVNDYEIACGIWSNRWWAGLDKSYIGKVLYLSGQVGEGQKV